ncbi:MAG: CAP domain-containing protein [Verrucomicrobiota bacterium]
MITLSKLSLALVLLPFLGIPPYLLSQTKEEFESQFLLKLNEVRATEGVPALTIEPKLTALSQEWSLHLAQEQKAYHRSSSSLYDFLKTESFGFLSENLHNSDRGNDPSFVLQRWLHSPVHQKNLLQPKIRCMGISLSQGKDGVWYVVWNGGAKNP